MGINRINELKKEISYAESKRKEFLRYVEEMKEQYKKGIISYSDFLEYFYKKHGGKNVNEWIEHLEYSILESKRKINRERIHIFLFWLL